MVLPSDLDAIRREVEDLGSLALVVTVHGDELIAVGEVAKPTRVASVRKSFMNALIGIATARNLLALDATLADLGIDDVDRLTDDERKATVGDLLAARSGITHPAISQGPLGIERGTYRVGERWIYNNWDFNVLGTIFTNATGLGIFEAFNEWIAKPTEMRDFDPSLSDLQTGPVSQHAAYKFQISPRDLARFGELYLFRGVWHGHEIVPSQWVDESTRRHSEAEPAHHFFDGYGLLWWCGQIGPHDVFAATGALAEGVIVVPELGLVIAHANRPIVDAQGSTVGWFPPTWSDLLPAFERLVSLVAS